jgi:hypothetical protein
MATRPPTNAIILNMGPPGDSEPAAAPKPTKKQDTLFGPNIGIVAAGPDWTEIDEEKSSIDELTPEIVKNWVAKSKVVRLVPVSFPLLSLTYMGADLSTDNHSSSPRQSQTAIPSSVPSRSIK